MTRGRHDLRWTVAAGYEGSASSEDALAQNVLAAAGARLVAVGSVRRAPRGRLPSSSTADGMLRRGVCFVAIASSSYRSHHRRFRTVGVISSGTPSPRAAVRTAAAIALAEGGVVRVYATAGGLPGDSQKVCNPLPGGATLQAATPMRVVIAGSRKILDLVTASCYGRSRLPSIGRCPGGRWICAGRCPVPVRSDRLRMAGDRAPAADQGEST